MSGANDFDFLLGTWRVHTRRRTNPFGLEKDGIWEAFLSNQTVVNLLDGKVQISHFEGTFPNGKVRKGLTLRTFDEESQQWSSRWLDNRNPHDFSPLIGRASPDRQVCSSYKIGRTPQGVTYLAISNKHMRGKP